jgi:hypothetical protein
MRPARKPRSRCGMTTPTSGMRSCRASARGNPTGTASTVPGTRPAACAATRPNCCSTPYAKAVSGTVAFGPEGLGQDAADPAEPSSLDSSAHVPGAWWWTRRSAGRMTNAPGTGYSDTVCTRSTSRASPRAIRTSRPNCAGPTLGWATTRRVAAGAPERARVVHHPAGADELLGLQHYRLLRAAQRLLGPPSGPVCPAVRPASSRRWWTRCTGPRLDFRHKVMEAHAATPHPAKREFYQH